MTTHQLSARSRLSSRSTLDAPRFWSAIAFTLIELLVVIAVISLLASMLIPITGAVNRNKIRARARAELIMIASAIENYKTKLGFYPPDAGSNQAINQLYYELVGTTLNSGVYTTLDGGAQIKASDVAATFGVGGFMNVTRGAGGDEGQVANTFLRGVKPGQLGELTGRNGSIIKLLVGAVPWPSSSPFQPIPMPPARTPGLNPWRYNMSNPTNNPGTYDLWMDVVIAGKKTRVSNWNQKAVIVTQ